jgi:pimeloyl-ACP methyl ester carboxylesterase
MTISSDPSLLEDPSPSVRYYLHKVQAMASGLLGVTLPPKWRYPDKMHLRFRRQDSSPQEIAEHYSQKSAPRDLVLFVHGSMADDDCWQMTQFNMTRAWEEDFGIFPVHVRYDTGRHISENGLDLASLLEELFQEIGQKCGRWHIVAHSMGGLVTRSALYQAEKAGMGFVHCIDKVFLIATPNRGAPLEKGVQLARLILRARPFLPSRFVGLGLNMLFKNIPVGKQGSLAPIGYLTDFFVRKVPDFYLGLAAMMLDMRSEGIRDLRHGYMLRQEWEKEEALGGLKPHKMPVSPLGWVRYYALAGVISSKQASGPSVFRTDGMVSTASVANTGTHDELRFIENNRYRELLGVSHFVMPFHKEVYRVLSEWFKED